MKIKILCVLIACVGFANLVEGNNPCKKYKDGTCWGTSLGFMDSITVQIVIKNEAIEKVAILKHQEDRDLGAIRKIPFLIKKCQGTQAVECITGATITSKAIKRAADQALKKAEVQVDTTTQGTPKE